MTFRLRLRVRYNECDAQGIVFNARWVDYVDIAVGEPDRARKATGWMPSPRVGFPAAGWHRRSILSRAAA